MRSNRWLIAGAMAVALVWSSPAGVWADTDTAASNETEDANVHSGDAVVTNRTTGHIGSSNVTRAEGSPDESQQGAATTEPVTNDDAVVDDGEEFDGAEAGEDAGGSSGGVGHAVSFAPASAPGSGADSDSGSGDDSGDDLFVGVSAAGGGVSP